MHVQPSCIQQLCKENIQQWTQPLRNHLKRETTKHGSSLMEVDWGGNIDSNYTSTTKHGSSHIEVYWGGNIDPNYTSKGCMLMQVDWGEKLRVNHINECMTSEFDWGAHETHQNGHNITKVDWGDYDPNLYPMDGCILFEVDWEPMMQCQRISSPKDCGEDYHKEHLPPLSWST